MIHNDIIIITVTLTISVPLGVIAAVKLINQYTRPPVNTLTRSGDIELVDYIEPTRPQQIYNYPDLLGSQITTYERLPSYHTVDRGYINCCLENAINLDFILWLILFLQNRFIIIFITLYYF